MKRHVIVLAAISALTLPGVRPSAAADRSVELGNAKGYLVIIGGGPRPERVMRRFADLAGRHASGRIVVIPNASENPEETGKNQAAELARFTERKVDWFNVTRENADLDNTLDFFEGAGGIFFSGGVQTRVTELMNGTRLLELIRKIYKEGGVIGGTSAGAAVQSAIMITGDERHYSGEGVLKTIEGQNIVTADGFGFLQGVVVDQHFLKRSRHNRLLSLVLEHPDKIGIGIDEQTAVIRYPDNTLEVIGESQAVIYDATEATIGSFEPEKSRLLSGYDLKLHILKADQIYDLKSRKVIR